MSVWTQIRTRIVVAALVAVSFLAFNRVACAATVGADAVVLVNSQSPAYLDFQHFIQPYLGNFGVPYTVLDISSNTVGTNIGNYALIIIGHKQLDTNLTFLTLSAQTNLSLAVSNGTGLVNFDNALAGTNNQAFYNFVQNIFNFTNQNTTVGPSVSFPPTEASSQMHYITSLHNPNDTVTLSNSANYTTMTIANVKIPTNVTAVATCGGSPFVAIAKYGAGRAVQWTSYDWMSTTIHGPVNGLDDIVWRGLVWAARKPFVMRGLPNFATFRIDDITGPFWWVHASTNAGFKPFLALFTDDIDYGDHMNPADGRTADLRGLTASGWVTATMHAFSEDVNNFFYFNHATESQWPDSVMSNNYARATLWHQTNNIPIGKVVALHYAEVGTNALNGLTNWGVQFVLLNVTPGQTEYTSPGAPWLVAGPYRLYETPQIAQANMPNSYADYLTVPSHPELNGKFFDCYTEFRNAGINSDWFPIDSDINGSVARGYNTFKRGFDSMVLSTLVTHEWHIQNHNNNSLIITTNHWQQMISGITNNLAPYKPIYVTLDYACQYVRATKTCRPVTSAFDTSSGIVSTVMSGTNDMNLSLMIFMGQDSAISNVNGIITPFTNANATVLTYLPPAVPQLLSGTIQSNVFTLAFPTYPGLNYFVQRRDTDLTGTWTGLTNFTATSTNATITDTNSGSRARYYRVTVAAAINGT